MTTPSPEFELESTPEERQRARQDHLLAEHVASHAGGRRWRVLLPIILAAALFPALAFTELGRHVIGIDPLYAFLCVIPGPLGTFVATLVYKRFGARSPKYVVADALENVGIEGSLLLSISSADSLVNGFWLFYFLHLIKLGLTPILRARDLAPPLLMPLLAGLWHLHRGTAPGEAAFALVPLALGAATMGMARGLRSQLWELHIDRALLVEELAKAKVRSVRGGIAADLHDGVNADLAAIAWRAEVAATKCTDPVGTEALEQIAHRARLALLDARAAVWGSPEPTQTNWNELVLDISERCHELCDGRQALRIEIEGDCGGPLPENVANDLRRMVQEAVRNASRHSRCTTIWLRLAATACRFEIDVEDDGVGLRESDLEESATGLRNLRRRAEGHHGSTSFGAGRAGGTLVEVRLPRPAASRRPHEYESETDAPRSE